MYSQDVKVGYENAFQFIVSSDLFNKVDLCVGKQIRAQAVRTHASVSMLTVP